MNNFIKKIAQTKELYVVEYKEGVGMAQSLLFQDEEGIPIGIVCFWSDIEAAQKCCVEDWKTYRPQQICLATFIEDYLIPIYNESLIVGLNFDENMQGLEADPLNVLDLLLKELKSQNNALELEYFKNTADLERQLQDLISKEEME